jgi:hypothetical protein
MWICVETPNVETSTTDPRMGTKGLIMPEGKHRKHTPLVSEKQRGLFGAELARRRAGKQPRMKGITTKELESHLEESKGKDLPARSGRGVSW